MDIKALKKTVKCKSVKYGTFNTELEVVNCHKYGVDS